MIYVKKSNKYLFFEIDDGGTNEFIHVATALSNNTWYFFTATQSSRTMKLSLDAGTAVTKTESANENYAGYWDIGYGYGATTLADPADSDYLNGSLSDLAIFSTTLTMANITTLYGETTQTSYAAEATTTLAANSFWPLNDTGNYLYPDAISGVTTPTTSFPDASGNGNTGTAEGGVGASATSQYTDGSSASFNGSSSYVETTAGVNPQVLSEGAWFETTSSGGIMGMTSVQNTATPAEWDRMLWVDAAGHVVYGVYPGQIEEITSPGVYNTGDWYYVLGTVGPNGMDLYIDGALVASNALVTYPQSYTGYWHLGFTYTNTWPDAPTSNYLNGNLMDAAVFNAQLTSSTVGAI
ncbi:MAG: LamG-like jellyroll fold domain-containing protein, partial [Candidatus Saccharimonadales bacterium]